MELTFNVKEKSIIHFFEEHAIGQEEKRHNARDGISAYHLMQDELYLKKSSGIAESQKVVFELTDQSYGAKTKLLNTYIYQSEKYDDVGIKLKLIDFSVTVQPKTATV